MKSPFLLWRHHGDSNTAFQLKLANFLEKQLPFMIVQQKNWWSCWDNEITIHLFWISLKFLPWAFDMENSEILDFKFEPTKTLQPDSGSGKSSKTCSSVDREPSTARPNEISVNDWCICFNHSQKPATKKWLCYLELNACEYFKMNRYIYLLTILQAFFTKLINEHIVTLL